MSDLPRRSSYKHYLLGLLMVLLAFNFADRWALGLVLQDIKTDFRLTDTQLGFLRATTLSESISYLSRLSHAPIFRVQSSRSPTPIPRCGNDRTIWWWQRRRRTSR